ncbi:uncharacterized protein LOC126702298 [Quercus robur]|uniref:uncharacterized protein LOC126702298 n=1 Tax=Quercus robur TaxID=38942 RepID=UPI002161E8CC|nr:uncharacterized protein LOC126702298 [Quercus robur]XP_050256923.1 uncharacterized protein LOC126702298 [Quercus robur]XP_050256925.1 uncharacterized protein LOC126702298 [Quercus robur]XP_050256926.1 uncharacterized protein LOC126702298 [Quercus robur]
MLIAVLGTFIFKKRKLIEVFPKSVRTIWNGCELRVLVLFSLFLQMVLILLGKRRKYIAKNWIRIVLWVAYLSADWIATVSLGVLSQAEGDSKDQSFDPNYIIMSCWAPFLLLHLGGPDTITAYSLEDNELWPRRLLELVVQSAVAFYVFLRSWTGTPINALAIPMFIAGIIKFGERIWVLRSASSDVFRDSMLPRPDPGPNYAKFMDGYSSKKAEGFKISVGTFEAPTVVRRNNFPDALHEASYFFKTFKRLFADLILSFQDRENSQSFFQHAEMTCEKAFEVIEIELGFMYDLLYTKANLIHSRLGSVCRYVSLSYTFAAFVVFLMIDQSPYSTIDKGITLLLLIGAIVLEIYAVIVLLSSDWTTLWLSKHENPFVDLVSKFNLRLQSCFGLCFLLPLNKRWSNSVAQYNLMSHCIKRKSTKGSGIKDFINKMLEQHWYKNLEPVPMDLKEKIFEQLKKASSMSDIRVSKQLFACSDDGDHEKKKCFVNLAQSMEVVDFDQSILLWHIATDLCYYIDQDNDSETVKKLIRMSKLLSNYLVHLLVKCPYMLPSGIGQIRFQDTCAEAMEVIEEREYISDENKACEVLFKENTEIPPSQIKGDRSKSVLFDACILAQSLQFLERQNNWDTKQKWETISNVWVELLSCAASQCRWNYHARQLRQGGELLTHVWLLMAHLGITEHFQISQGHLRAKLLLS